MLVEARDIGRGQTVGQAVSHLSAVFCARDIARESVRCSLTRQASVVGRFCICTSATACGVSSDEIFSDPGGNSDLQDPWFSKSTVSPVWCEVIASGIRS